MIKGDNIILVPATLQDRGSVYRWCFQSETTKSHSGPPDYPEIPIATYKQFCEEYYEEYFFTGSNIEKGRGYIIVNNQEPVGFISYSSFHLKPFIAEIDIWMSCEANCGKGFGVEAIVVLGDFLNQTLEINSLLIAPASKNIRAVKAYQKAGFKKTNKDMKEFLLDEYIELYGNGDYGIDETTILIKELDT